MLLELSSNSFYSGESCIFWCTMCELTCKKGYLVQYTVPVLRSKESQNKKMYSGKFSVKPSVQIRIHLTYNKDFTWNYNSAATKTAEAGPTFTSIYTLHNSEIINWHFLGLLRM